MMNNSSLTLDAIRQRSKAIAIPERLRKEFLDLTMKWRDCSGEEWLVSRLKAFKTDLLADYNGQEAPYRWFKKTVNGHLSGVFGRLKRYAMLGAKNLAEVVKLLMLYSSFVSEELTDAQEHKFLDAVTTDRPLEYPEIQEKLMSVAKRFRPRPLKMPGPFITKKIAKPHQEAEMLREWMTYSRSPRGIAMVTSSWFVPLYPCFIDVMGFRSSFSDDCTVGTIGLSQELGYKARFYASPHQWIQHVTEGLKHSLLDLCKQVPWDGTHDQRLADEYIIRHQQEGKKVFCFDLSNATDLFPRSLQFGLLDTWYPDHPVVSLYKWVCEDPWKYGDREIKWTRGQPLGTNPSFPLFALTHGLSLLMLNNGRHDNDFFIVGDDVVILKPELASAYSDFLDEIQVDWSPTKTLSGTRVAEFTGYLYIDGKRFTAPKWRPMRDYNILDILSNFGPRFLKTLSPKLQEKLIPVVELPEPVGLGWNPLGKTLEERLEGVIELYDITETPLEYRTDLFPQIQARFESLTDREQLAFQPAIANSNTVERIRQYQLEYNCETSLSLPSIAPEVLSAMKKITLEPSLAGTLQSAGPPTKKSYSHLSEPRLKAIAKKVARLKESLTLD